MTRHTLPGCPAYEGLLFNRKLNDYAFLPIASFIPEVSESKLSALKPRPSSPFAASGKGWLGFAATGVLILAASSLGLMTWSHLGWEALQTRGQRVDQLLSNVQIQARQNQVNAERRLSGEADISPQVIEQQCLKVAEAIRELRTLVPASMQDNMKALEDKATLTRLTQAALLDIPARGHVEDLHMALANFEYAATQVQQQWSAAFDAQVRAQRHWDQAGMLAVGSLTVLLMFIITRTRRKHKLTVAALRTREAQLRAFADALPDLAFHFDAQGRYLDIYGNNLKLLGRPPEELIGRALTDVFPESMAKQLLDTLSKTLQTHEPQTMSLAIPMHGQMCYFETRCAAVPDTNEVVWMAWDDSSRREIERRLRHKTRMYDFVSQASQVVARSASPEHLFRHICDVAVNHGRFDHAWVALIDTGPQEGHKPQWRGQASASKGTPLPASLDFYLPEVSAHSDGLSVGLFQGQIFRTRGLPCTEQSPQWIQAAVTAGTKGCVVIPLRRDNALVGHLFLLGRRVSDDDPEELSLFEALSLDLSFALSNLHHKAIHAQDQERMRLHAAALESAHEGMIVLDSNQHLVSINRAFTKLTGYTEADVLGHRPEFLLSQHSQETITRVVAQLRRYGEWEDEVSFQCKDGHTLMIKLSISAVRSSDGQATHFVGMFTDITTLKETEARLARMAHFDQLTELPNRVMLHERLQHAIDLAQRHQTQLGIVFIDLDNFKTVNDGLGHAAGDSLLRQVAKRLRQRVRQEDTLGRLSGDEFLLVLEQLNQPQQAAQVASAILETLNQPFTLDGGQQVYVRASIGISMFPNDGETASELIRNADAAMYESKRNGRNSFHFYTEAFTALATNRLKLETRLRQAIAKGGFELHYQPILDLHSRHIVAIEALVRLLPALDEDGHALPPMSPAQFIPVMEETGMITALGEWVVRAACQQGKAWLDEGLDFGRIAINLSPAEIRRGGVVARLARVLQDTGLAPDRLEIEITESGLMESGVGAERFLQALHELGVYLSIDDFGTGYSSLAYLKRFPVHQLKIDRSFVQDLPGNDSDCQLVGTMITMAHGLHMKVVAEGVEMSDQEAFLASRGCDRVQGYLYSRPMPAQQIASLLGNTHTGTSWAPI